MTAGEREVTWYGTASIRVRIRNLSLLFDPFVPLPGASHILSLKDFLPAPYVLVTHGHFDHLYNVSDLVKRGTRKVFATSTPCATLMREGVRSDALHLIQKGDRLHFSIATGALVKSADRSLSDADTDIATVTVLRGRHTRFGAALVLSTLLNFRMLRYGGNTKILYHANKAFCENGETVVYEVSCGTTLVTILGSLAIDEDERYTLNPDLLVLPYQGNSHLLKCAAGIVKRLMPRAVMLDHHDDSFPPLSRDIDTAPFVAYMAQNHPGIPIIAAKQGIAHLVG